MLRHGASVFVVSAEICSNFYKKKEVLRILSYPDHQEKCGETLTHVVDSLVVFYTACSGVLYSMEWCFIQHLVVFYTAWSGVLYSMEWCFIQHLVVFYTAWSGVLYSILVFYTARSDVLYCNSIMLVAFFPL